MEILSQGTEIKFKRDILAFATTEHPDLLLARKDTIGKIVGRSRLGDYEYEVSNDEGETFHVFEEEFTII